MHPKNAFKYCPSCGKPGLSFHNDAGYLKCDACGFLFFINEAGAVAAIIQDEGSNILFTKRAKAPAKAKLDLPGGFVDIGETAEQALEREIMEELNIRLVDYTYFMSQPNTYTYNGLTYFTLDLAFVCQAASLKNMKSLDDISGVSFIHPAKVNYDDIGLDSIKTIIKHFISDIEQGR
ncbi:MAG: NUDIX hydrolase [Bacteroidota bacterium]